MLNSVSVKVNDSSLKNLIKTLKNNKSQVKIGILGDDRNATIGAVHEFGTESIPVRSFLRKPISENLSKKLQKIGLLKTQEISKIINEKKLNLLLKKIGEVGVVCVLDAFTQQGPGWAKWKNPNYKNNANMILTDTGQLRNSINYEVK